MIRRNIWRIVAGLSLVLLVIFQNSPVGSVVSMTRSPINPTATSDSIKADSTLPRVYVPNQKGASISILNRQGDLLTTVDLTEHGFSRHASPHQVISAPDGSWYVTLAKVGAVAKFNNDNDLVAKTKFRHPGMIGLDHTRDRIYVSRSLTAVSPPTSLGMFRASDLKKLQEVDIFISRPHALAIDSVSGRVYSASLDGNQIAAFDPISGEMEVVSVEKQSGGFVGLDVSPDGKRLVASTQQTNELLAFDIESLIPRKIASISVGSGPYDVRYSPNGKSVWFPNQDANTVTMVNTSNWKVTQVIEHDSLSEPHGVAVSPDGRTVYISSHGKSTATESPPTATLPWSTR